MSGIGMTARPTPLQLQADNIPTSLRSLRRFVGWNYVWRSDKGNVGKWTKPPFVATEPQQNASSTNPDTWRCFDDALQAVADGKLDGLGVSLGQFDVADPAIRPGNRLVAVDLDHCIEDDGHIVEWAQRIIAQLNTYAERSPSGHGVRLLLLADGLPPGRRKKVNVEMYDSGRYVTLTGHRLPGPAEPQERTAEIAEVHAEMFPPEWQTAAAVLNAAPGAARVPLDLDDQQLIDMACRARNGWKFLALWQGDVGMHQNDHSAADEALCFSLAFWTGCDAGRIDRLFRRSGLMRDKWDERRGSQTYGERTLSRALERVSAADSFGSRPRITARDHAAAKGPRSTPPTDDEVPGVPAPTFLASSFEDDRDADLASMSDGDESRAEAVPSAVRLGEIDPRTNRVVLSPRQTLPTAQRYVGDFHTVQELMTLRSYAGQFLEWRENRYAVVEDATLKHRLQPWLHEAMRYVQVKGGKAAKLVPFESNPTTIAAALDSIRSYVHLETAVTAPAWLDRRLSPPASEILSCRSANVHIPTRCVLPATPALFTTNALEFDFDPRAPEPTQWLSFLRQLWPDDDEQIALLQQWFGYFLTPDTSQQKILVVVGPRRGGKGTISDVLKQLVGPGNVAGPTTNTLVSPFGLQDLLGKSVAVISDARFSGEHIATLVERLLSISGEGTLSIQRKYLPAVTLKLPTRFMFLTNELPRLTDSSTAMSGRLSLLNLTESFYGREDPMLRARLLRELPGILLWALDGWQQLHDRGRFLEPVSTRAVQEQIEALSSPISVFVRETCRVGSGFRVVVDRLYGAYKSWCEREGRNLVANVQTFGRDLRAVYPEVSWRRGTDDQPFYDGITLRAGE